MHGRIHAYELRCRGEEANQCRTKGDSICSTTTEPSNTNTYYMLHATTQPHARIHTGSQRPIHTSQRKIVVFLFSLSALFLSPSLPLSFVRSVRCEQQQQQRTPTEITDSVRVLYFGKMEQHIQFVFGFSFSQSCQSFRCAYVFVCLNSLHAIISSPSIGLNVDWTA